MPCKKKKRAKPYYFGKSRTDEKRLKAGILASATFDKRRGYLVKKRKDVIG